MDSLLIDCKQVTTANMLNRSSRWWQQRQLAYFTRS